MKVLKKDTVDTLNIDEALVIETIDTTGSGWEEFSNLKSMARIAGDVSKEVFLNKGQVQKLIRTLNRVQQTLD